MPAAKDKKPVGRMACEVCGGRAAVYQNTRHYLYTRCGGSAACKCNQDNSPARQLYVWSHLEPLEGAAIFRPRNVPESVGDPGQGLAGPAPVAVLEQGSTGEPQPAPAAIGAAPAAAPAAEQVKAGPKPAAAPAGAGRDGKSGNVFWGFVLVASVAAGLAAAATG